MGRYVIRRTIQMIPLFIGISIIIFLIIQAAPGGPETTLLATGRFVSPEILAAYRTRLGLDQPIFIQYFRWLGASSDLQQLVFSTQACIRGFHLRQTGVKTGDNLLSMDCCIIPTIGVTILSPDSDARCLPAGMTCNESSISK